MSGGEEMTDIEKAKELTHLFYVLSKQRNRICHHEKHMKTRDIMALGMVQSMIAKHADGLVKMSEISEKFHVTPAAVSQMVREYEKKGWLERVVLDSDRRSVYLKVSEEAISLIHRNEEEAMKSITDFIRYLGDEDSDALLRILKKANAYGPILRQSSEPKKDEERKR